MVQDDGDDSSRSSLVLMCSSTDFEYVQKTPPSIGDACKVHISGTPGLSDDSFASRVMSDTSAGNSNTTLCSAMDEMYAQAETKVIVPGQSLHFLCTDWGWRHIAN